jgi:hemerythrin
MTNAHENRPMDIDNDMADVQHKKLRALRQQANQLLADNDSNSTENFHTLLNDFAVFTREYFAEKEEKIRRTNPDRLDSQVAEHITQESQLTDILISASAGILDKTRLHNFLSEWWSHHEQNPEVIIKSTSKT